MALINSHREKTHVLPGCVSDTPSEKKKKLHNYEERDQNTVHEIGKLPAHAMDENDGIHLSSKENRYVWLAIILGQIIFGLTIYMIL